LVNAEKSVLQNEREQVFKMLPRFDLLLVDCADEAELYLLRWQHQHHGSLCVMIAALYWEKMMLCDIIRRKARALQELTIDLNFASSFVQGGRR
jgi:hypothetical protein